MRHRFLPVVMSALLYVVALPPTEIWGVAFICLVPWLLSVRGFVDGAIGGLFVGTLAGALLGDWIPAALIRFEAGPGTAWLAWILAAAWVKGAPFLALGAVVGATRGAGVSVRVGLPVVAVLAIERLQSIEPLGAPWTLLGHSQASNLGVAQLAVIGGVPLVSALVFATNLAIAESLSLPERRATGRRFVAASLAVVAVLSVAGVRVAELFRADGGGPEKRVLGVQFSIPRGERWVEAVQRSTLSAGLTTARNALKKISSKPDLVVLPESVVTTPVEDAAYFVPDVSAFARAAGVSVALGGVRKVASGDRKTYRNSAFLFDPSGALTATVDKRVGVPFVESRPSAVVGWIWPLLGALSEGPKMEMGEPPSAAANEAPYVVLLCYEVFFPGLAAARRTNESLAILQLADDSWAKGSSMSRQVIAAAAFRAIEQRLTLIRVAHAGLSAVIDPYGRVVEELPMGTRGYVLAGVRGAPPSDLTEKVALAALAIAAAGLGFTASSVLTRRAGSLVYPRRPHSSRG